MRVVPQIFQRAEDRMLKRVVVPAGTIRQTSKNYREYVRTDSLPVISLQRLKTAYKDALEQKNKEVDEVTGKIRTVLTVNNEQFSDKPLSNPMFIYAPCTVTTARLNSIVETEVPKTAIEVIGKSSAIVLLGIMKFLSAIEKKALEHFARHPAINAIVIAGTYIGYFYGASIRKSQNATGEAITFLVITLPYIFATLSGFLQNSGNGNTGDNVRKDLKTRLDLC